DPSELVFGGLLVAVLLGLGGYYGWRQWQRLSALRAGNPDFAGEERYYRNQARRRLICSILMILFALLLVGHYFLQDHLPVRDETAKKQPDLTPDEKASIRLFSYYWIGLLVVFLAILGLAAYDLWATRRFALRQLLKIHERHHELIEEQALRLRGQRDGYV